jgi:cytidylate kinase
MQVICISRSTQSGGKEMAQRLAEKLDYVCLSREELMNAAIKEGIQVGKLEMAIVKGAIVGERLALERDHYLAFTTAYLCDRALEGGVVYHGRTGHFLLPGVTHVLKVRVIADEEFRIGAVMRDLNLDRAKARRYIADVDEDRRRWVRSMYGVSWDEAANYDIVLNLAHMSVENAATTLMQMAQLPDFQTTPASLRSMEDLRLGAKARLLIARDDRTHAASVKVRADRGVVNVTYLPHDAKIAAVLPEVCRALPGLKDIRITMATTTLLWLQEEFRPDSPLFNEVIEIATKWNAAVELLRFAPQEDRPAAAPQPAEAEPADIVPIGPTRQIAEDLPAEQNGDAGLKRTLDELARVGRSGGGRVLYGDPHQVLNALDRSVPYSLVVVGDVFLSKGHAARLRATRDFRGFLSERIKAPVVTADELEAHYLFHARDLLQAAVLLLVAIVLYAVVFTHQETVLAFLGNAGWYAEAVSETMLARFAWLPKVLVSLVVFLVAPVVAYLYGTAARVALKAIGIE